MVLVNANIKTREQACIMKYKLPIKKNTHKKNQLNPFLHSPHFPRINFGGVFAVQFAIFHFVTGYTIYRNR